MRIHIQEQECLSFDDVLLKPLYSNIESRNEVDIGNTLSKNIHRLKLSVISAPMDTITEYEMVNAMKGAGGLGIIHRYNTINEQVQLLKKCPIDVGCAIGASGDYLERAKELVLNGCPILCIDVAHGHHSLVIKAIEKIKTEYPNIHLMAGNVASWLAAEQLARAGADSIKIGIGGGSICETRTNTGHGIPTFQSLLDIVKGGIKNNFPKVKLIVDGGIRTSGDIVKALAAGADFVMLGSMLAGTTETPGEIENISTPYWNECGDRYMGKFIKYKVYRGMASREAQEDWRNKVGSVEGISVKVPWKGSVHNVLEELKKNIASGFSYSGARNLNELQSRAVFIRQTNAGRVESSTHILNINGVKQ